MIKEFKDFIAKGNVMDMAVGIIIGAAFTAIVTSLVGDLINPIISLFMGGVDFASQYTLLGDGEYAAIGEGEEAGIISNTSRLASRAGEAGDGESGGSNAFSAGRFRSREVSRYFWYAWSTSLRASR